jgi:centromere protein I
VQKIEKIELPNQLVAVMDDPLLQKFLALRPSETINRRLANWLNTFFEDEMAQQRHGQSNSARLTEMLRSLLAYTQYTKVSLCRVEVDGVIPNKK